MNISVHIDTPNGGVSIGDGLQSKPFASLGLARDAMGFSPSSPQLVDDLQRLAFQWADVNQIPLPCVINVSVDFSSSTPFTLTKA